MQLIFAHASESRLYYTLDEGVTFIRRDLIPNTLNPRSIKYHPTRDGWMVALDSDNSVCVVLRIRTSFKNEYIYLGVNFILFIHVYILLL